MISFSLSGSDFKSISSSGMGSHMYFFKIKVSLSILMIEFMVFTIEVESLEKKPSSGFSSSKWITYNYLFYYVAYTKTVPSGQSLCVNWEGNPKGLRLRKLGMQPVRIASE